MAQLNRLNAKQMYQLVERVKIDYTSSGMSDTKYVLALSTEPGWPWSVSPSSVMTARSTLEIPANGQRGTGKVENGEQLKLVLDELAVLQNMVAALGKQMTKHFGGE